MRYIIWLFSPHSGFISIVQASTPLLHRAERVPPTQESQQFLASPKVISPIPFEFRLNLWPQYGPPKGLDGGARAVLMSFEKDLGVPKINDPELDPEIVGLSL